MKIIAVDPGGTTGVAAWNSDTGAFDSLELPTLDAVREVEWRMTWPQPIDLVVVEAFVISQSTVKKTRAGSHAAIESIGALRYIAWKHQIEFDDTQKAEQKKFATAARLKKLGWYRPSPGGHQNDAARHLLVAAVRRGLIDPAQFLEDS